MQEWINGFKDFLDVELFEISGTTVTLATALTAFLIILLSFWVSWIVRKTIKRTLMRRKLADEQTIGSLTGILHYVILVLGFGIAIQTLGIDLGALFAAGAIFAIGLGFAMQNIAENFVAGTILLLERSIRPGDVLEVEGRVVKVIRMGIRATVAQSRDGEELIVPNAVLVQNTVKNYTLQDSIYRLRTSVGVTYDSDLRLVRQVLEKTVQELQWSFKEREPQVFLDSFGDNAVIFNIAIWIREPWGSRQRLSELNEAIWWALKEQSIVIAFPQLDLHLDPAVMDNLHRLAGPSESAGQQ